MDYSPPATETDEPSEFIPLGHRPALDGIRGVAILSVLAVHTNHIFGWSILSGGNLGVDIFFVLSGFLITSILLAEVHEKGKIDLKRFYIRRALRLVPALVAMLVVLAVASPYLYSPEEARDTIRAIPLAFLYVTDFAIAIYDTPLGVLRHTWSLSIEEQFYLLWPLMLLILSLMVVRRRKIAGWVVFLVFIFAVYRVFIWMEGNSVPRTYFNVDTRADALLVGCLAGMLFSWGLIPKRGVRILNFGSMLAVLGLGVGLVATDNATTFLYFGGFTLFAIAAALLILGSLEHPDSIISGAMTQPALVWIGRISYGVYLWHYPVFKAVRYLDAAWYQQLVVALFVTFAVSYFSYRIIERPFLRMKERFV